jgi:Tripartite tricarboxylate transporter family receptor
MPNGSELLVRHGSAARRGVDA